MCSLIWKEFIFKRCNWFEHMTHPRRHSDSLWNWTGRMKECNVFYELKCFQVELLFQTEGLCVWREETTDMQMKKKSLKRRRRKRSTRREGLQLIARFTERQRNTVCMEVRYNFPQSRIPKCVFLCAVAHWIKTHGDRTIHHTQHTLMLATWTAHIQNNSAKTLIEPLSERLRK